ncbi:MAG: hypothetical protein AABY26_06555 [Nanoarchaeota archaeon]
MLHFNKKAIEHPASAIFIAAIIAFILGMLLMYLLTACIIPLPWDIFGCGYY